MLREKAYVRLLRPFLVRVAGSCFGRDGHLSVFAVPRADHWLNVSARPIGSTSSSHACSRTIQGDRNDRPLRSCAEVL